MYGFYSPYLDSFGGGERYLATAAEFFQNRGKVIIFWDDPKVLKQLEVRFNLNLAKVEILPNVFAENLLKRSQVLKNFDLVFILSDGSIPTPFAAKNILHFQQPFVFQGKSFKNRLKLKKYTVICNSNFTKKYIDESFGIDSAVIYPPVDVEFFKSRKKENVILSVGRFLPGGQGKKQEVLIEAFRIATRDKGQEFRDWQLYLAGGVGDKKYFSKLQQNAKGLPINFFPDINANQLKELYGQTSIYWHAKGFGEDVDTHPEFAEHFGISVVEAAAAGCVPVIFEAGGVKEIISGGVNGFFWRTGEELIKKTENLISNADLFRSIQKKAIISAKKFSKENFFKNLKSLI